MTSEVEARSGWLSADQIRDARAQLPILYVEALPVRCDSVGSIVSVGLLLRAMPDGSISRSLVTGRHLEKDLGNMAMPQIPLSMTPVSVSEYFPNPEVSGLHDPRQHAVALSYIVPVSGDCAPSQASLDLAWLTPSEASSPEMASEMTGGQHKVLLTLLASVGAL